MQSVADTIKELLPEIREIPPTVVSGVADLLEERAVGANTVTRNGLREMLRDLLQPLQTRLDTLAEGGTALASNTSSEQETPVHWQAFFWGGRFRRVPQDFELPKGGMRTTFQQWCLGNPAKGHPPLQQLQAIDMGDDSDRAQKNKRRRLADLHALMGKLKNHLIQANHWIELPSLEQVNTMFDEAVAALDIPPETPKGRKRRLDQISWTTIVREVLTGRKKNRLRLSTP